VELLKQTLIEYGFHPDTLFNTYNEYSWKVKAVKDDSLLIREAGFYLLDTTVNRQTPSEPGKKYYLKIYEYQYLPESKKEYTENLFPVFYEEEAKKNQFFDRFYNLSRGLRHLPVPDLIELHQKITIENRYILLVVKLDYDRVTDTTMVRELLKVLTSGINQSTKERAEEQYGLLRENTLVKSNIFAGKNLKALIANTESNKTPMEIEVEINNNLQQSINENRVQCHCVDVCTMDDGCINGGFVFIKVLNDHGFPVTMVKSTLVSSKGEKYQNTTDVCGCAGWCRVPKGNYTIEIYYESKKYLFDPVWDTLPRIELIELKNGLPAPRKR
jgi:hypothetical protein